MMEELNFVLQNWIFFAGAILAFAAFIAPDRRLPKVAPKAPFWAWLNIETWPIGRWDWKPFAGFLIPAIALLMGGAIWANDPWLRNSARGFWLGASGTSLAALDLAQKGKKSKIVPLYGLLAAIFIALAFYPQWNGS